MLVSVSSPFPLDSPKGNSVSASRIAGILGAEPCHGLPGVRPDVLIALHAKRSANTVREYLKQGPGKVVILLTGTDLHRDIAEGDAEALWSLEVADVIAVYHEAAKEEVPEAFREKVKVCWKSMDIDLPAEPLKRENDLVTVVQHLREIKDPFLPVHASQGTDLRVVLIGSSLQENMTDQAEKLVQEGRCEWVGNIGREAVLDWQCRALVTVNSAFMEGAGNAMAEAMFCETPILATRICGNVGMLGEDYEGYFDCGDEQALRALLLQVRDDADFRDHLLDQVRQRLPLFTREHEERAWKKIVTELS